MSELKQKLTSEFEKESSHRMSVKQREFSDQLHSAITKEKEHHNRQLQELLATEREKLEQLLKDQTHKHQKEMNDILHKEKEKYQRELKHQLDLEKERYNDTLKEMIHRQKETQEVDIDSDGESPKRFEADRQKLSDVIKLQEKLIKDLEFQKQDLLNQIDLPGSVVLVAKNYLLR